MTTLRRVAPAVVAMIFLAGATVAWQLSRTSATVTEDFPGVDDVAPFSVTYDAMQVSGPWTAASVVCAVIAVALLMRTLVRPAFVRPDDN